MTDISFYHLTKSPVEKALPLLLYKIMESKGRAVLIADSEQRLNTLDTLLWTFSTNKVVPHGTKKDGFIEDQPVYITLEEENPNDANFLVMIDGKETPFVNNFQRCLMVFNGDNQDETAKARELWKKYKNDGHELTYWKQNDSGAWEKAQ